MREGSFGCAVHQRDRVQVVALAQPLGQEGQAVAGRDQHPDVAVLQDVGDLGRLEQRVDGHEHAAGRRGAEEGHHRFGALGEVDRHALGGAESAGEQALGEGLHPGLQLPVGDRLLPLAQGDGLGAPRGLVPDEVVQQHGQRSPVRVGRRAGLTAARGGAAASFAESVGCSSGQAMPIAGSFQRMEPSCSGA